MIERLMNPERPYGEPEYSGLSAQAARLKQQLVDQLDTEGRECLEQLEDTYLRRENAALRDAFADGFWTAVKLALEYRRWQSP